MYQYYISSQSSTDMEKKLLKSCSKKSSPKLKLPPIETSEVKTVLDIDPHFYSLIENRPIRPNKSLHKYKHNIRNIALKRTLHGYVMDEILRINREIETERKIYNVTTERFDEHKHSFDKFLDDDNNKTIVVMTKSDNLAKDLANQTDEHKQVSFELATLKSKLQYITESLQILLSFQGFLFNAAPILWQEKENKYVNMGNFEIISMDSDIFCEIDKNVISDRLSKLPSPSLYFKTPDQLLNVFNLLEKQNLNYLLVTEELNMEKNKFVKSLGNLKKLLWMELDYIREKMREIEETIAWNEMREIELQRLFYKILDDKLSYLVSSQTVLQIFNYVTFAYEHVIAPNDANLSSLDMMMALEREYNDLMLDLSVFDLQLIKSIEKETYENEAKETKRAKEANKLLKDVDKLSKRLKSSYEPSRRVHYN